MLDLGSNIQESRDHTPPRILHQAGSWKCQLDTGKCPLCQGTSAQGDRDNPQSWSGLWGGEGSEERKEGEVVRGNLGKGS